jgi:addiction module HigA family antidote
MPAPKHPGQLITHYRERRAGISLREMARQLGVSHPLLSMIESGTRQITPYTARELERVTGRPAAKWLEDQAAYDLWVLDNRKGGG